MAMLKTFVLMAIIYLGMSLPAHAADPSTIDLSGVWVGSYEFSKTRRAFKSDVTLTLRSDGKGGYIGELVENRSTSSKTRKTIATGEFKTYRGEKQLHVDFSSGDFFRTYHLVLNADGTLGGYVRSYKRDYENYAANSNDSILRRK